MFCHIDKFTKIVRKVYKGILEVETKMRLK